MNRKLSLLFICVSLLTACELTEGAKKDLENAFSPVTPDPSPPPIPPVDPYCFNHRFTQPDAIITKKIDILFVTDTSGSLDEERAGIANGIDGFIQALPSDVDYQIGVMLGHGSTSSRVGRLYRYGSNPHVLKSSTMSIAQIRGYLKDNLTKTAGDGDSDGGEEGMYSIQRAIAGSELAESKSLGFFRNDAALAIVFIADENDICARFPQGYTPVLDTNYIEPVAFARDCANVTSENTVQKIKAFQGDRPLVISGIVYTDLLNYPKNNENEYGWGYMEMIQLQQGVAVNLANADYFNGLKQIGALATVKLNIMTEFTLTGDIDIPSIMVWVDGLVKPFTYIQETKTVHLPEPGGALSTVDIYHCLGAPGL